MPNTKQQQSDTSKRGFASMDKEEQKEIASKGGHASHGNSGNGNSSRQHPTEEESRRGGQNSHSGGRH